MSEFFRPEIDQTEKQVEDPRRDAFVSLPREMVEYLQNADFKPLAEFEQTIAAQMMPITIAPTETGRTNIVVAVPEYKNAVFLPENTKRREWEEWQDPGHTLYERLHQASHALAAAQEHRQPIAQAFSLPFARVGLGTIYQYQNQESGQNYLATRINNDWENNAYSGWGNPYSSLVRFLRPGIHPSDILKSTVQEVIPAHRDQEGRLSPYYPEGFFYTKNVRSYQDYKRKALQIEGSPIDARSLSHEKRVPFEQERYNTGVDLTFDYSALGKAKPFTLRDVNAFLSLQGTLEVQTIVTIPQPELLLDPEFKSEVVLADTHSIAEWWYRQRHNQASEFNVAQVIDGQYGLSHQDESRLAHYRHNFRVSPPLVPIFNQIETKFNFAQ